MTTFNLHELSVILFIIPPDLSEEDCTEVLINRLSSYFPLPKTKVSSLIKKLENLSKKETKILYDFFTSNKEKTLLELKKWLIHTKAGSVSRKQLDTFIILNCPFIEK